MSRRPGWWERQLRRSGRPGCSRGRLRSARTRLGVDSSGNEVTGHSTIGTDAPMCVFAESSSPALHWHLAGDQKGHATRAYRSPPLDVILLRLKSFARLWVAIVLLCGVAPAGRLQGRAMEPRPEPPRRLAYRFDLRQPGRVHVSLETPSPAAGAEMLDLPSQWAEARDLQRSIENLKITGSEVSLEPTSRLARFTLKAKPGTLVRVDYDLVQDWTGPLRASERHRVLIGPELVEFNGDTGLVAPKMETTAAVQVSFDFVNLPARHVLVTSFGTDTHQTVNGPWGEVANALFVAGELSTRQIPLPGGPVLLATAGHWSFSDQELALKLRAILAAEREFWRTSGSSWYAVVLAPYGTGTTGGGGSAFTHAFSLFLAPSEHIGPETESLVAHEAFHAWNPANLGTVADTQRLAWFVEGFTTFYQDVLLERGHLIDQEMYVRRLNVILRDLFGSPTSMGTPGLEVRSPLDDEETRYRAPYLRGAVIALWLNGEIVRQSGGRWSLDDLMRGLLAEHGEALTADRIYATAGRFVRPATVAAFRSMVDDGTAQIQLPEGSVGPCLSMHSKQAWSYVLGVPASQLTTRAILHDVDREGPAFRDGVRDGQMLLGWSLWRGDADHEVALEIRELGSSAVRTITYLPRGRLRMVPQAEVSPECAQGLRGGEVGGAGC